MSSLPKWYYDLTDTSSASSTPVPGIASPPGFEKASGSNSDIKASIQSSGADNDKLKVKRAWELAFAPGKSLPMNLFMSYMSGNSLQIVPIMMTSMMFFVTPFKQLMAIGSVFEPYESKTNNADIRLAKVVYVLCHLLTVGAGVWKLGMMGLLPNTRSDWLAWESAGTVRETTIFPSGR